MNLMPAPGSAPLRASDAAPTPPSTNSVGRVLVVDDEAGIREVMRHALEREGFEVRELEGSGDLEEFISTWRPDLILSDVLMPGRDGLAVVADLQRDPATRDIPIVLVTAKGFANDQRSALEAGVAGYLVKPFEIPSLLETVRQALSGEAGVRVWGCRGAIATPEHAGGRFGGNTSCVELVLPAREAGGRRRVIFDAGTGVRALGNAIFESPVRALLCLTHFHWDHVQGLPFFKPLYQAGNQITLCGPASNDTALVETIREQMGGAFFPISIEAFAAAVSYRALQEQEFEVDGLQCSSFRVMHPGLTLAYKVTWQGRSFVYCPDNELHPASIGTDEDGRPALSGEVARLAAWLQGVDVLLHDCQYSAAGYESHRNWGHSHARALAALSAASGVRHTVLFHHDPDHGDDAIEAIHGEFRQAADGYVAAMGSAGPLTSQIAGEGLFLPL